MPLLYSTHLLRLSECVPLLCHPINKEKFNKHNDLFIIPDGGIVSKFSELGCIFTLQVSPQMTGRPTKIARAPRASALSTSVPVLIPPSR